MSNSKEQFKRDHMLNLRGKDYLPVAARVVLFREDHPDASILTTSVVIGEDLHMRAEVSKAGVVWASGHKKVRFGMSGPAGQYPIETAETGAIGRALALCGYGTLSGDLDEGEELADAPVERAPATQDEVEAQIRKAKTKRELEALIPAMLTLTEGLDATDPVRRHLRSVYRKREDQLR